MGFDFFWDWKNMFDKVCETESESLKRERKYAKMYKNFCKHLLEELRDEHLRNENELKAIGGDLSYITLRKWSKDIVTMAETVRGVYKNMNEYLVYRDDEFLGRKHI